MDHWSIGPLIKMKLFATYFMSSFTQISIKFCLCYCEYLSTMPTFKKSKNMRRLFTDEQLKLAVKDVTEKRLTLRRAVEVYGVPKTTLSRYVRRARQHGTEDIFKQSMVTKQVNRTFTMQQSISQPN